jgi:hypothetical protein
LETEKANVVECNSKLGKQALRIQELQNEVELHKQGAQS